MSINLENLNQHWEWPHLESIDLDAQLWDELMEQTAFLNPLLKYELSDLDDFSIRLTISSIIHSTPSELEFIFQDSIHLPLLRDINARYKNNPRSVLLDIKSLVHELTAYYQSFSAK